MNKVTVDKLMNGLITISQLAIVAGALFKLQHWAYGDRLLIGGALAYFVICGLEIRRLKRIISNFEREK